MSDIAIVAGLTWPCPALRVHPLLPSAGMTSQRPHDVVDLTHDSDVSSSSSFALHTNRPLYTSSLLNPAKRTRIDPADMTPVALLNPRAHVAKNDAGGSGGPSSSRSHVPQPGHADRHAPDTPGHVSLSRRMESLHGLKDRKVKAPKAKDGHRETAGEGQQDRRPGQSLLSKHTANGSSNPDVIDLTCTHPHIRFMKL